MVGSTIVRCCRRHLRGRHLRGAVAALGLFAGVVSSAVAEDPPAVVGAAAEERDALRARIAAAISEGAVSYWDAVITPETNNELVAGLRRHYGLPASFVVKYTLSATLNLVTRVEQEVGSGNVTMDVASLAS